MPICFCLYARAVCYPLRLQSSKCQQSHGKTYGFEHTHIHTHTHPQAHTHTHKHLRSHSQAYTHRHTHTHTHTPTDTHTHAHWEHIEKLSKWSKTNSRNSREFVGPHSLSRIIFFTMVLEHFQLVARQETSPCTYIYKKKNEIINFVRGFPLF